MTFEEFIEEWKDGGDSIAASTSGSTGIPKKITLNKEFVRASALRTNSFFHIGPESRLHSCVAPDFIGGKMMAVRASEAGCRLTWEKPSNRPLEGLSKDEKIDLLAVVPSQMLHIVENMERMPGIRHIIVGGSPIDARLRARIKASRLDVYETYGMTETASHIALRRATGQEWFETLPGISVGTDSRGCLVISFDSGERVVTNDLATVVSPCRFRIDGRLDHVIISGGRKINPFRVEERIAHLIPTPFVVTSVPDEKWGRKVILKIEGGDEAEDADLLLMMVPLLEKWEVPKEIIHLARLSRTPGGKLIR